MLEKKMQSVGIEYQTSERLDKLVKAGIQSAPVLEVEEGQYLPFKEAWNWVNKQ